MQQYSACDYCRIRKRKCDRQAPRCSLCTSKNQNCTYTRSHSSNASTLVPVHSSSLPSLNDHFDPLDATPLLSKFPSCFFLDHEIFVYNDLRLSASNLVPSAFVKSAVSTPLTISNTYFDWVHLWMPIISKRRWYKHHVNSLMPPKNHVQVLLFCMKLIAWKPGTEPHERQARTKEYLVVKQTFLEAEQRGAMNLQLLQAMLLLTLYEYAHAIYPAAYMTIAACSRYGIALGIHKQHHEQTLYLDLDLDQQEERRRVWWAVVILDRILSPEVPCSPEPRPDDLLPVDDQIWDDGTFDEADMYTVSSTASTKMGMFARLSQASYLLGRVLNNKCAPTRDAVFDIQERAQLQRALRALLNLTYEEGATRLMSICPQTALCLSAMVILNSPSQSSELNQSSLITLTGFAVNDSQEREFIDTMDLLRPIADESLLSTEIYYRNQPWPLDRASPLLLYWTHLIAVTFHKLSRKNTHQVTQSGAWVLLDSSGSGNSAQEEAFRGYQVMRNKLKLLGQQWCAADEYIRLLDVRSGMN